MNYIVAGLIGFLMGVAVGRVWEFSIWANKLIDAMH
jgi:hypothetical protein